MPSTKTPRTGIVEEGNIDLSKRVRVHNPDGTTSTIRSASFNDGKHEILVPTLDDSGRQMSNKESWDHYKKTGRHLGKFRSSYDATAYAKKLSKAQGES